MSSYRTILYYLLQLYSIPSTEISLYQISYHNNINLKFYEYGIGLNSFGAIKILKRFYERAITISVNINRFSFDPSGRSICFIFPFIQPKGITMIYLLLREDNRRHSRDVLGYVIGTNNFICCYCFYCYFSN